MPNCLDIKLVKEEIKMESENFLKDNKGISY